MFKNKIDEELHMAITNIESQGNVEGQEPIPELYPPGSLGRLDKIGRKRQIQDVEAPSKEVMAKESVCQCDSPQLSQPDSAKLTEANVQKAVAFLKDKEWFSSITPFLSTFLSAMFDLLDVEGEIFYKEAMNELDNRGQLMEFAKSSAELAKLLQDNKAQEHRVQAYASFGSAAVSGFQFMQTTRNLGTAKREVEAEIATQKSEVLKLERNGAGFTLGSDGKKWTRNEVEVPEEVINDSVTRYKTTDDYKNNRDLIKQQKVWDKLEENKSTNINQKTHHLDEMSRHIGDGIKQTLQGVQGLLQATIATDTGVKEAMKIMIDGFTQALNKYNETTTKSRDDARANHERFIEFMNRIITAAYKAQHLQG
jgi:hypothetical protein